ncbi:MAG: hypothetical protein Q8R28_09520, partial [Dehalococcoidia bacterium]|nr:hypothetical protein [Dehalococcoidia bacterium]
DDRMSIVALRWRMNGKLGSAAYRLPVNIQAVGRTLEEQHRTRVIERLREGQAARTAWRIAKTWVEAQMAILETGSVAFEEVFLPYMLVATNVTIYDRLVQTGGIAGLLPPGQPEQEG